LKRIIITILIFISYQSFGQLISDESYKDESFWKFKTKLESCVIQQDTSCLKEFLADRIHESNEYGTRGCSKDEFIGYYFRNGEDEIVWEEMQKIIRFGFHRFESQTLELPIKHDKISFQAPSYLKAINPELEIIILGENVNIREKPSLKAKIIKQTSFEKFNCDCDIFTTKETTFQKNNGIEWLEIYLSDGQIGYVAAKFTSYLIFKEMTISKVNGEWKIISYYHPPGC